MHIWLAIFLIEYILIEQINVVFTCYNNIKHFCPWTFFSYTIATLFSWKHMHGYVEHGVCALQSSTYWKSLEYLHTHTAKPQYEHKTVSELWSCPQL